MLLYTANICSASSTILSLWSMEKQSVEKHYSLLIFSSSKTFWFEFRRHQFSIGFYLVRRTCCDAGYFAVVKFVHRVKYFISKAVDCIRFRLYRDTWLGRSTRLRFEFLLHQLCSYFLLLINQYNLKYILHTNL